MKLKYFRRKHKCRLLNLKNVSRVYKSGDHELKALDGVNFSLEEGKFVVILGPSGAGKSTLLNLLGGLDSPTSRKIYVERLFDYGDAGKIQLIRKYGQLISEGYTPDGIAVKAYVPKEIYTKI